MSLLLLRSDLIARDYSPENYKSLVTSKQCSFGLKRSDVTIVSRIVTVHGDFAFSSKELIYYLPVVE